MYGRVSLINGDFLFEHFVMYDRSCDLTLIDTRYSIVIIIYSFALIARIMDIVVAVSLI